MIQIINVLIFIYLFIYCSAIDSGRFMSNGIILLFVGHSLELNSKLAARTIRKDKSLQTCLF